METETCQNPSFLIPKSARIVVVLFLFSNMFKKFSQGLHELDPAPQNSNKQTKKTKKKNNKQTGTHKSPMRRWIVSREVIIHICHHPLLLLSGPNTTWRHVHLLFLAEEKKKVKILLSKFQRWDLTRVEIIKDRPVLNKNCTLWHQFWFAAHFKLYKLSFV